MKKTTPDAPAPTAKIRSQRARPTTVLGRTWVRKSPLVSGLGSRGWPIGAVYAARWAATLHRGPHGDQRTAWRGKGAGGPYRRPAITRVAPRESLWLFTSR